jgi:sodium transport system permease protein
MFSAGGMPEWAKTQGGCTVRHFHDIWLLYRRELRSAVRERSIVVNSILVPIFLYPVILWAIFSGVSLVEGRSEGLTSRVAIQGLPPEHGAIADSLAAMENVDLVGGVPGGAGGGEAAVRGGELDAVVMIEPARGAADALEGNFVARLTYDQSEERGRRARDRVAGVIESYRAGWLEREATALEIPPESLAQFAIERNNVASGSDMGAFILSLLIPLMLVIMVALGCFYPAIDATAGERERSTWETLMTVSASRTSVLVAKYLYVATLGIAAGILNVVAMVVTVGAILGPLLGSTGADVDFTLPLMAIPIMALGAIGLALLFAALMMILASFAQTFKEGQAMITPVYYLALLPVLLVSEPDLSLDAGMAAIPVANVMLMIRDAFQDSSQWLLIAETMGVVLVMVAASLVLARYILGFEDLLMGSYDGNLWKFVRERVLKKGGGRGGPGMITTASGERG